VTVHIDGELAWPLVHLDERALEVTAPRALAPNLLLELTVMPSGLHCFAIVERCTSAEGQWTVRLTPFAMQPEEARRWQALTTQRAA
jgi:hypothetical protein